MCHFPTTSSGPRRLLRSILNVHATMDSVTECFQLLFELFVCVLEQQPRRTLEDGRISVSGGAKLKDSQRYPKRFGTAVFQMYTRHQDIHTFIRSRIDAPNCDFLLRKHKHDLLAVRNRSSCARKGVAWQNINRGDLIEWLFARCKHCVSQERDPKYGATTRDARCLVQNSYMAE